MGVACEDRDSALLAVGRAVAVDTWAEGVGAGVAGKAAPADVSVLSARSGA